MKIELKGIIQASSGGHKIVSVLVRVDEEHNYEKNKVGIDLKVNHGMILQFLTAFYGVKVADIVWPEHIKAKNID